MLKSNVEKFYLKVSPVLSLKKKFPYSFLRRTSPELKYLSPERKTLSKIFFLLSLSFEYPSKLVKAFFSSIFATKRPSSSFLHLIQNPSAFLKGSPVSSLHLIKVTGESSFKNNGMNPTLPTVLSVLPKF